jgi:hypothetical protein
MNFQAIEVVGDAQQQRLPALHEAKVAWTWAESLRFCCQSVTAVAIGVPANPGVSGPTCPASATAQLLACRESRYGPARHGRYADGCAHCRTPHRQHNPLGDLLARGVY